MLPGFGLDRGSPATYGFGASLGALILTNFDCAVQTVGTLTFEQTIDVCEVLTVAAS